MAATVPNDIGILKKIVIKFRQTFYNNNTINYKAIILASSSLIIVGYIFKSIIKKNKENRISFQKFYYKTHANSLRYINLLVQVHLPLSINSIFIISHLRYLKKKGETLHYNEIKYGYFYGLFNFIMSAFVINRIIRAVNKRYLRKIIGDEIAIKIFEKYILSAAQSKLVTQMTQTNKILREKLGLGVKNIKDLENIIWQYIGPIDDAVDYTEFKEVSNYVQVLKDKFISEQKVFLFERYLLHRAIDMFDFRPVTKLPIWNMKRLYTNSWAVYINVTAQFITYLARLFGKMTLSQIWYLVILEFSGNHDLLDQYLYSLMSREPLYLVVAFPFFILRFTRLRADKISGALKDWIVVNVKEITQKLFGDKGFTNT